MIETGQLDAILDAVSKADLSEDITVRLRESWPDIHFTYCLDDDIAAARPVREHERFNLYLVSSGEGCISFSSDPANATGVVVAEIECWEELGE